MVEHGSPEPGHGPCPQNRAEAGGDCLQAADQGHPDALNNVGVHYFNNRQYDEARHWWELAIQKGSKDAETNIKRLP